MELHNYVVLSTLVFHDSNNNANNDNNNNDNNNDNNNK